jgi:hypothetical protein
MNKSGVSIIGEYSSVFDLLLEEAGIAPDCLHLIEAINPVIPETTAPDVPLGVWFEEPDIVSWTDTETGYQCAILRAPRSLHLCGYVQIGEDHPLHGADFGTLRPLFQTTRPLSFSSAEFPLPQLLEPLSPRRGWVFGFDCAQGWDYVPGHHSFESKDHRSYRTFPQVADMCRKLALSLRAHARI